MDIRRTRQQQLKALGLDKCDQQEFRRIFELPQRSEAWYRERARRITATDAAFYLRDRKGQSCTDAQFIQQKYALKTPTQAQQQGIDLEPLLAENYVTYRKVSTLRLLRFLWFPAC